MSDAKNLGIRFVKNAREIAKKLKDFQQDLKKVKFVGSFTALYWSVCATAFAVIPGGLAAPLVAIAMVISGIGGVVHVGASFADMIVEKFNLAVLEDDWKKFVKVLLEECKGLNGQSEKLLKRFSRHTAMVANGIRIGKNLKLGAKIAKKVMILNAIAIPLNLIDFVRSVEDLRENGMSEVCKLILQHADKAEELIEKLETIAFLCIEIENGSGNKDGNGSGNTNGKCSCDDTKNSKTSESITPALSSKQNCKKVYLEDGYFYRK